MRLTVVCVLLMSAGVKASASEPGISYDCRVLLNAPDLRVGSTVSLTIHCKAPWGQDAPLIIEYCLPAASEVVSNNDFKEKSDGGCLMLHWEGMVSQRIKKNAQFKITKNGFYMMTGTVSLGDISKGRLQSLGGIMASSIPAYKEDSPESTQRRKEFLSSITRIRRMLSATLDLSPKTYYIRVTDTGGRIETWDFNGYWKKIRHWLEGKGVIL